MLTQPTPASSARAASPANTSTGLSAKAARASDHPCSRRGRSIRNAQSPYASARAPESRVAGDGQRREPRTLPLPRRNRCLAAREKSFVCTASLVSSQRKHPLFPEPWGTRVPSRDSSPDLAPPRLAHAETSAPCSSLPRNDLG